MATARRFAGTLVAALAVGASDRRATEARTASEDAKTRRAPAFEQIGTASWYGPGFHGKITASGATFDQHQLTAAHRSLPLGTEVQVTNMKNGASVEVEINDRGPYVRGRVIDLSRAAAVELGMKDRGLAKVKIQADSLPGTHRERAAAPKTRPDDKRG